MFDFKAFRNINKLKQSDAAAYFGCAQAFISQIERGISKIPEDFISKIKSDGIYKMPMPKVEVGKDVNMPREVFDKISQLIDANCSQRADISSLIETVKSQQRTIEHYALSDRRADAREADNAGSADVG